MITMPRKATTSRSEIEELINKGFTQTEIAKIVGISKSGVNWHLKNTGGKPFKTLTEILKEALPWEITGDQVRAIPYRRLLFHLKFLRLGAGRMTDRERSELRAFYEKLTAFRVVVRYDPDIPPRPGQQYGLFEYAPKTEEDGDLILRLDHHTTVPEENREDWRLPPREDWPE